mmetsp:Transcript_86596/g.231270  ORF Transcript_86596/g.231270 Transcript_86596/m.231270 type:complete len:98 (-) Transcript_86596:460-753(-)
MPNEDPELDARVYESGGGCFGQSIWATAGDSRRVWVPLSAANDDLSTWAAAFVVGSNDGGVTLDVSRLRAGKAGADRIIVPSDSVFFNRFRRTLFVR